MIELPRIPQPNMGRPKKLNPTVIDEYTAAELVDLLLDNHGDLEQFFKHFHVHEDQEKPMLTRVYMTLNEPGNEEVFEKWNNALRCFKLAQVAIAEREAMNTLSKVPKATVIVDGVEKEAPMQVKDYVSFAGLWLTDIKEEARARGKKPQTGGLDDKTRQAKKYLDELRGQSKGDE